MFNLQKTNEQKTMTSIELLNIVNESREASSQNKIRANDFNARIADELEGEHYESFVVENSNKTKTNAFKLTFDQCMLVGMRESKVVRRSVLSKIKELESKEQFNIPQTLPEALQLAADLALKIEQDKPKIAVYEMLADRRCDVSTTIVAKELGTTAIKLNKFLREIGAKMLRIDAPKAGYESWFNVVSDSKNGHEFTQCLVTPEGQIEIAKLWGEL